MMLPEIIDDRFAAPVKKPFRIYFPKSGHPIMESLSFDFCDKNSALMFARGMDRFSLQNFQVLESMSDFMGRGARMAHQLFVTMGIPRTGARLYTGDSDEIC